MAESQNRVVAFVGINQPSDTEVAEYIATGFQLNPVDVHYFPTTATASDIAHVIVDQTSNPLHAIGALLFTTVDVPHATMAALRNISQSGPLGENGAQLIADRPSVNLDTMSDSAIQAWIMNGVDPDVASAYLDEPFEPLGEDLEATHITTSIKPPARQAPLPDEPPILTGESGIRVLPHSAPPLPGEAEVQQIPRQADAESRSAEGQAFGSVDVLQPRYRRRGTASVADPVDTVAYPSDGTITGASIPQQEPPILHRRGPAPIAPVPAPAPTSIPEAVTPPTPIRRETGPVPIPTPMEDNARVREEMHPARQERPNRDEAHMSPRSNRIPLPSEKSPQWPVDQPQVRQPEAAAEEVASPLESGDAPYMSTMGYEDRAKQRFEMDSRKTFGNVTRNPVNRGSGIVTVITGSNGGVGKTTTSYVLANTAALAAKALGKSVWLIEADYTSPKLQARLKVRENLGPVADLFRSGGGNISSEVIRETIYKNVHVRADTGLKVLCCPYDLRDQNESALKYAILTATRLAQSEGGYVFVDTHDYTTGEFENLDTNLVQKMAHRVVVVTTPSHVEDDFRRTVHLLTSSSAGSASLDLDSIHGFLNYCSAQQFRDIQADIAPITADGFFPMVPDMMPNHRNSWVGNTSPEVLNALVARAGNFFLEAGYEELSQLFSNREPVKKPGKIKRVFKAS